MALLLPQDNKYLIATQKCLQIDSGFTITQTLVYKLYNINAIWCDRIVFFYSLVYAE